MPVGRRSVPLRHNLYPAAPQASDNLRRPEAPAACYPALSSNIIERLRLCTISA